MGPSTLRVFLVFGGFSDGFRIENLAQINDSVHKGSILRFILYHNLLGSGADSTQTCTDAPCNLAQIGPAMIEFGPHRGLLEGLPRLPTTLGEGTLGEVEG